MQEHEIDLPEPPINLSPKQLKAIALLSTGTSLGNVAKELEVDPATINRWGHSFVFKTYLRKVSSANLRYQLTRIHAVVELGVGRLLDIMKDPDTTTSEVLKALKLALDSVGKFEDLDNADRLEEIEKILGTK